MDLPVVEPSGGNPLDGPFLGFGAEWDSNAYLHYAISDSDFSLIRDRIKWMRLPLCRMMMLSRWCYRGGDDYSWDNPQMKLLLRQLDICEELGITVMLTEWGVNDSWMQIPGITKVTDPKYAEVVGHYLTYLIKERNYHCIKYFIFCNEPRSGKDGEEWLTGLSNVAIELKKQGLNDLVALTAPDQSGMSYDLVKPTIEKLGPSLGAYDLHLYARQPGKSPSTEQAAKEGSIRSYLTAAWKSVRRQDPSTSKPLILGEGGFWAIPPEVDKPTGAAHNGWNRDWHYGLFMAEFAVQAVQSGTWGLSAWMLDDNSHVNFDWGLWANKTENFALKPWFYPWSLLCRSFPPGSTFVLMDPPIPGFQMIGAKLPTKASSKGGDLWSFCIVNPERNATELRLRIPEGGTTEMVRYLYGEHNASSDKNGFPTPLEKFEAHFASGVPVTCPPESVTILTPATLAEEEVTLSKQ